MNEKYTLWRGKANNLWYLIPDSAPIPEGNQLIETLTSKLSRVDLASLTPYEISEAQARLWAKEELGEALTEIRSSIDDKLDEWRKRLDTFNNTPVSEEEKLTPNAVPVLWDLLKQLPGVIGNSLSGEEARLGAAKEAMADLQLRLRETGIDLDSSFNQFPDRLAGLRREVEEERKANQKGPVDPSGPNQGGTD